MQKEWDTDMKNAKEYVRKLQVISLKDKEKEEIPEERDNLFEKYVANQKLGVLEALLTIGDWPNAQLVIKRVPEHYSMDYQPVALALCQLLHYIIDPVYRE